MSDFQKQQRPGLTPIKNPLLSASVTGITFDGFPNKPLLLPAAPAIVHAPVHSPLVPALLVKEPKTLVTVGSSSLDTESLDEINLNSSNESNQTTDVTDPNASPLLEPASQGFNSDSILSQAASSFSALPSVASNVFSTFSKRITGISSRETTPTNDHYQQDSNANVLAPQLGIQPSYIQQSYQKDLSQVPPPFYAPPSSDNYISSTSVPYDPQNTQTNLPPPEPPKFYIPAEVPSVPSTAPPTNLGGQNNFRFSSKKKLYAPIPGLSDQCQKLTPTLDPSSSINYCSQSHLFIPEEQKLEERKVASGLFSKISNLAPTGVLQNIGLVQSATGSLTQSPQGPSPVLDQQNSYFTIPPPPANYFVHPTSGGNQTNTDSISTSTEHINIQNTQTSSVFSEQQAEPQSLGHTQIPLFSSSNIAATLPSSSEQPATTFFNLSQSNPADPSLATAATPVPVELFDPTKYLPPSKQTNEVSRSNLGSHTIPPPTTSGRTSYRLQKGTKLYKNPLTPQETAPVQITPSQIPTVNQSVQSYPSQQSFNTPQSVPLYASSTAVGTQNIIHSVPPVGAQSSPLFAPSVEKLQTAPPLSSSVAKSLSTPPSQSINLFGSTIEELKSKATPLLDPTSNFVQDNFLSTNQATKDLITAEEINSPFAPPIKKPKPDESVQEYLESSASIKNETNISAEGPNVESLENKFVTLVPKQDTNSDIINNTETSVIFETIEPVLEENITCLDKDTTEEDQLEVTLDTLSLTDSSLQTKDQKLPPIANSFKLSNSYRSSSTETLITPAPVLPTLANFFTPEPSIGSSNLNFFNTQHTTSGDEVHFSSNSVEDKHTSKENPKEVNATNFFAKPLKLELTPIEPVTTVNPSISVFFPTSSGVIPPDLQEINNEEKENFVQENVPPPIGFESSTQVKATAPEVPEITTLQATTSVFKTQQPEIVNRFSNYFNQTNQQIESSKDPSTFFDSFPGQQQSSQLQSQSQPQVQSQPQAQNTEANGPSVATNEEQRIQYFFNNPPPKDASSVGDLNYDLVHSGLGIKNLQQRSLTPISNLVEPPSSACSEFSELSNCTAGQKSIAANLSITESSGKLIEKKYSAEEQNFVAPACCCIKYSEELPEEVLKELEMADKNATKPVPYKPAVKHWFFKRHIGDKDLWVPFSHYDSALLETSLHMECDDIPNIVAVEGGRYDVNINERKKISVYWDSPPIEVRRCSWFYKAVDSKYVPYAEETAELLENEYKQAAESGVWHKHVILGMGEQVEFHGPTVIVHFQQQQNADSWGGTTQTTTRPRVVRRDLDDFNIEQGESQKVDHLLFMVHGIGSACDLKLRSVEEVVEDFRTIARQLVQSHYKNSADLGLVGRVEVLPISWHSHLHSVEMGIDEKLRMITLESIPKLRNFTNDTLLDILFYTSPTFCQKIMNTITSSMNTLYLKYRQRHPEFNGGVSLAGHSLGSLILFDLLCHQNPIKESEEKNLENPDQVLTSNPTNLQMDSNQLEDKQMSYTMGPAGTGQPFINYAQLIFQPKKFFAFGSPIGVFVTIRGIDKLGLDFRLPTCPGFYNIFHPYDPVAYRIEALVNPDLSGIRPVLIPHHKGRKRMHLELKETMTRVSADLKNRFLDKFKTTLDSVNIFGSSSKSEKEAEELMEKEVDKVIQMQMQMEQENRSRNSNDNLPSGSDAQNESMSMRRQRTDSASTAMSDDIIEIDFPLGKLNDSKRIDYVLQEAPLEFINEYIFALSSHVCYWDSEDTILFVMKEIYSGLGISPDSQVPQQTMTIERPSSRNS